MYPMATQGVAGSSSSMLCTATGQASDWARISSATCGGAAATGAEQCEAARERRQVRNLEYQRHPTSLGAGDQVPLTLRRRQFRG